MLFDSVCGFIVTSVHRPLQLCTPLVLCWVTVDANTWLWIFEHQISQCLNFWTHLVSYCALTIVVTSLHVLHGFIFVLFSFMSLISLLFLL